MLGDGTTPPQSLLIMGWCSSTWLKSIGAGNYSTWPGLTLANATKYFPSATATILGHLVHKRQGVRSTKTKLTTTGPQYPRVEALIR